MPRVFTPDYRERVTLRDGTPVIIRLVVPSDAELLRTAFERWSPDSRYARFLAPKQTLTEDELQYLCDVDQEHHFALAAGRDEGDGTEPRVGLGIARFIRLPGDELGPVTAEAAIAVADDAQGKGLGRVLFTRLVAAAAERAIERFRCEVLGSNRSMQQLIADVAPERTVEVGGGIVSIEFALPHADANDAARGESAMYRFFRAAAEGAIEWTDAVRRFWRR